MPIGATADDGHYRSMATRRRIDPGTEVSNTLDEISKGQQDNEPAEPSQSAPDGEALKVRQLRVAWPEETHQPLQYTAMKVGGLEMIVDVPEGQDPVVVARRAFAVLDAIVEEEFDQKLSGFLDRTKRAVAAGRR